ncbi:MAG TPA: aa3-type cytochrome c oxidase subunit IV [Micropepsaceae bacterium]|nr:aa3-type cytochrome c oxidase subunit IV [Micropepsaceae bacterium]
MSSNTHHAVEDDAPKGTMDISDHVKMWFAFWNGAKWSAAGIVVIVALLAIFRTHNG